MSKLLARMFVLTAYLGLGLVNYWFTFRLWPVSWTSFVLCMIGSYVLLGISAALNKEDGQ